MLQNYTILLKRNKYIAKKMSFNSPFNFYYIMDVVADSSFIGQQ